MGGQICVLVAVRDLIPNFDDSGPKEAPAFLKRGAKAAAPFILQQATNHPSLLTTQHHNKSLVQAMSFAPAGSRSGTARRDGHVSGLASGSISRILDEASSGGGRNPSQSRRRSRSTSPNPSASASSLSENTAARKSAASAATQFCTFCSKPAALTVSSSLVSRPYCLTHYYTSRAVRTGTTNPNKIHIIGPDGSEIFGIDTTQEDSESQQSEMAKQLPAMQDMFAEAFTSLRDRIANKLSGGDVGFGGASSSSTGVSGASRKYGQKKSPGGGSAASKRNSHDPLADLLGGPSPSFSSASAKKRVRKRPPSERPAQPKAPATRNKEDNEGGFVRDIQLPTRYVEQQRKMAQAEVAQRRRLMSAPGTGSTVGRKPKPAGGAASALSHVETNPYKRRKPNRSSIWNLAMNGDNASSASGRDPGSTTGAGGAVKSSWDAIEQSMRPTVRCTCGSTDVSNDLNITGRGNDMPKGETWGSKDRSDVVVRYRCGRCGKTWNEEE